MTAEEMFRELGYGRSATTYDRITYYSADTLIIFYLIYKYYEPHYRYSDGNLAIDGKTHLAIHQQCKELGWI